MEIFRLLCYNLTHPRFLLSGLLLPAQMLPRANYLHTRMRVKVIFVNKPTWRTTFSSMFISILYMFRTTMCPSSGELTLSMRYLLYVTLDVCLVCTCTPDRRPHTVTYTSYRTDTVNSPDDGHIVVRNMYRIEINIDEKVVRQVGLFTKITLTLIRVCK